jgi:hypothetical protein
MVVLKGIMIAVVLGVICLSMNVSAQGITPGEILKEVTATYESMQTYRAAGTIVADIDTGNMKMSTETSFSILLMKPNLYLISWTQKNMPMAGMNQDGAVWSDGAQPYLYMGIAKAYSKMSSDEMALAGATGISGGAAFTIPSLFFKQQPAPFSSLKDPAIEKTEQVGEEDCYVVSGSSAASKKETFWISKSNHLIVKYSRSLEREEGAAPPDMTDEQLDEAIKGMGQQVTEENRKNMRGVMDRAQAVLKNTKTKGLSTETHVTISSPELSKADFRFVLPSDAVMKDSLFGGILSGGK